MIEVTLKAIVQGMVLLYFGGADPAYLREGETYQGVTVSEVRSESVVLGDGRILTLFTHSKTSLPPPPPLKQKCVNRMRENDGPWLCVDERDYGLGAYGIEVYNVKVCRDRFAAYNNKAGRGQQIADCLERRRTDNIKHNDRITARPPPSAPVTTPKMPQIDESKLYGGLGKAGMHAWNVKYCKTRLIDFFKNHSNCMRSMEQIDQRNNQRILEERRRKKKK